MRHFRSATVAVAAVAIGALTFLAACSPRPDAAVPAGPAAPAADASSGVSAGLASTTGAEGGSGGAEAGTCGLITPADVQPFMTGSATGPQISAVGTNSDGHDCVFTTDDGPLDITVAPDSDPVLSYAAQIADFGKPVGVPGIGDKAVRDASQESGAIVSIKGGTVCSVSATDSDIPGVGALDEAAGGTDNIGDANYAIIAAALGTLCNRIYGSGNTTPDLSGLKVIATSGAGT